MKKEEQRRLDRLLSGGAGPSVQEKEAVLESVLDRCAAPLAPIRPSSHRWWILAPAALATAAALVLIVLLWPRTDNGARSEFTSRGGPQTGALRISCTSPATPESAQAPGPRCRPGDTLVFALDPPAGSRYFSAAALGPGGLLIWYFPSEKRRSLALDQEQVARRGVMIGPEHVPGGYRLLALFSEAPVSQAQMRGLIEAMDLSPSGESGLLILPFEVVAP